MVGKLGVSDGGDSANDAAGVRVVLFRALDPFPGRFLDVDLALRVGVPEVHAWHDWHRVLLVVDVQHCFGKNLVHKVRKVLITNPGHAVPDDFDNDLWG